MIYFTQHFDSYVCEGDEITAEHGPVTLTAYIERDPDYSIDDDDCHNPDQRVTGCNDEQQKRLLHAREAWFNDEWFYCGIVVEVVVNGVELGSASLWGIECNYPAEGSAHDTPNNYLRNAANEIAREAIEEALDALQRLNREAEGMLSLLLKAA